MALLVLSARPQILVICRRKRQIEAASRKSASFFVTFFKSVKS